MSTPAEACAAELKALDDKYSAEKQARFAEFDAGRSLRRMNFEVRRFSQNELMNEAVRNTQEFRDMQKYEHEAFLHNEKMITAQAIQEQEAFVAAYLDARSACLERYAA